MCYLHNWITSLLTLTLTVNKHQLLVHALKLLLPDTAIKLMILWDIQKGIHLRYQRDSV